MGWARLQAGEQSVPIPCRVVWANQVAHHRHSRRLGAVDEVAQHVSDPRAATPGWRLPLLRSERLKGIRRSAAIVSSPGRNGASLEVRSVRGHPPILTRCSRWPPAAGWSQFDPTPPSGRTIPLVLLGGGPQPRHLFTTAVVRRTTGGSRCRCPWSVDPDVPVPTRRRRVPLVRRWSGPQHSGNREWPRTEEAAQGGSWSGTRDDGERHPRRHGRIWHSEPMPSCPICLHDQIDFRWATRVLNGRQALGSATLDCRDMATALVVELATPHWVRLLVAYRGMTTSILVQ